MNPLYLVNIAASPAIEETLVDWLLEFDGQAGFTSYPVDGHSSRAQGLTLAEQVAGRKRQLHFQVHLPEADLPVFLDRLKRDFAGAGLHYWVSPVIEAGHL
jgi:hypothetical protein